MTNRQLIRYLLFSLILAAATLALWRYEIVSLGGGASDLWLRVQHWSPYLLVALGVAAVLLPARQVRAVELMPVAITAVELYLTYLVAYHLCRILLISLLTGYTGYIGPTVMWILLAIVGGLTAYSTWLAVRRRMFRISTTFLGVFTAIFFLSFPAGWIITHLRLGAADGLTVVRLGWPQALIVGLLGLASTLAARRAEEPEAETGREDILDESSFRP